MLKTLVGILLLTAAGGACSPNTSASMDSSNDKSYVESEWEAYSTEDQIRLASFSGECALRMSASHKANASTLTISFGLSTGQTTVPSGTYSIGTAIAPGAAYGAFNVRDSTCHESPESDSIAGSVTLTSELGVAGIPVAGSYSIKFADGTSQSGEFNADFCDTSTISGTSVCAP